MWRYRRCRTNRCRYEGVWLYLKGNFTNQFVLTGTTKVTKLSPAPRNKICNNSVQSVKKPHISTQRHIKLSWQYWFTQVVEHFSFYETATLLRIKIQYYKFCEETAIYSYTFQLLEEVSYWEPCLCLAKTTVIILYPRRSWRGQCHIKFNIWYCWYTVLTWRLIIFIYNYGNITCNTVWVFW
jgi:hypothetical protein